MAPTPRHSVVRSDHIEYGFWLIFDDRGGMRFSRGEPNCARDERSMYLSATLPLALWSTPTLRVTLTVDADAAPRVDLALAVEHMRAGLGVDVDLQVRDLPVTEPLDPPQPGA